MGLRPLPVRWFEALAVRDDLSRLAEALARSGVVQIEAEREADAVPESADLRANLEEYERLARRYEPYWPSDGDASAGPPDSVVARALDRVREWVREADPSIGHLDRIEHERVDLSLYRELLRASGGDFPEPQHLLGAGPALGAAVFVLPRASAEALALPSVLLVRRILGERHEFVLFAGPVAAAAEAEAAMAAAKARRLELPSWLPGPASAADAHIDARLSDLRSEAAALRDALAASHAAHRLGSALADLRRLSWFARSVPPLAQTRHFAVVTGWTSDPTGGALREAVERSGVRALVQFPPAPSDREPPIVLRNPGWIRPFETFARLIGTPARHEADPSPLLAVIVPLLFGFMFGDVGQGLVLVGLGLWLRKRLPVLRLLVPGGLAAAAFGVLFGSVFSREDLIRPLWVSPLAAPLVVLASSAFGGAVLLLLGLLLAGVEALWRGALWRWAETDAALVPLYLGLLGMLADVKSGLLAVAAMVWHVLGSAVVAEDRRLFAALTAAGHLVERTLQLTVNTISFARVGAFALAHAGLSTATAALSQAAGHPAGAIAVLILGNALAIGLEGLVVSVQTTRLVLFEFFARFFRGEGRAFRPLLPPPPALANRGAHVP